MTNDVKRTEKAKYDFADDPGFMSDALRDNQQDDLCFEAEQVAKSYGFYLEYNRAIRGRPRHWMYMIRLGLPGGGPINPAQWRILDELAEVHCAPPDGNITLRLTTRGNIQFHWVPKSSIMPLIRTAAEAGLFSLNSCGDNVRSVMGCPMPAGPYFNPGALARALAGHFSLDPAPYIKIFTIDPGHADRDQPYQRFQYGPTLLNRKFKIAIATIHGDEQGMPLADNCVEALCNDLAIVPVIHDPHLLQLFVGGGQGEKRGKNTASMLAQPLARVDRDALIDVADAIVSVHRDYGERHNRHAARLKYLLRDRGMAWFRQQVEARCEAPLLTPINNLDPGARHLHHGWHTDHLGRHHFGLFIENGRLSNQSANGRLRSLVNRLTRSLQRSISVTPNQDLIVHDIERDQKSAFNELLREHGYGERGGIAYTPLRLNSGACVGLDTCRLAYTESERFLPILMDDLETRGWGHLTASIGMTGCERQCFRPATKTIGLVGAGHNRYALKLFGTEDGRHQGIPLSHGGTTFLTSIPRDQVVGVVDALFRFYRKNKRAMEKPGTCFRRCGSGQLVAFLRADTVTEMLMNVKKTRRASV